MNTGSENIFVVQPVTPQQENKLSLVDININLGCKTPPTVPPATLHNSLAGLQGGSLNERYHLTKAQYDAIANVGNTPSLQEVTDEGNITTNTIIAAPATNDNEVVILEQLKTITDNILPIALKGQIIKASDNSTKIYESQDTILTGKYISTDEELAEAKLTYTTQAEIFNTWKRFAHGNAVLPGEDSGTKGDNIPGLPESTNSWSYNSSLDRISSTKNSWCMLGFVSNIKVNKYIHRVTVGSTGDDNDKIGLVIAFTEDENDLVPNTAYGRNPADFNWDIDVTSEFVPNQHALILIRNREASLQGVIESYYIVYDYQKTTERIIASGSSLLSFNPTSTWAGKTVDLEVIRDGDIITVRTSNMSDAPGGKGQLNYPIILDLNSDPDLIRFKGHKSYGYACQSQANSYFSNIYISAGLTGENEIYDLRNGDIWVANSSGVYSIDNTRSLFTELLPRTIVRNLNTNKYYYIDDEYNWDWINKILETEYTLQDITENGNSTSQGIQVTGVSGVDPSKDGVFIGNTGIGWLENSQGVGSITLVDNLLQINNIVGDTQIDLVEQTIQTAGVTMNTRLAIEPALNGNDAVTLDQLNLKANLNNVVTKDGMQTITGYKVFTISPDVPTPTTNTAATPKSYVDGLFTNIPVSNLSLGTRTSTTLLINNSNGTGVTLPIATQTLAGLMSGADKTKLDGINMALKANLAGGNMFTGNQRITSGLGPRTNMDGVSVIITSEDGLESASLYSNVFEINNVNSGDTENRMAQLSPLAGLVLKTKYDGQIGQTNAAQLKSDLITGGSKLFQFPNASGTLALISDLAGKQNVITLTTVGTSGLATFNPTTGALNIPNYTTSGGASSLQDVTTIGNTTSNNIIFTNANGGGLLIGTKTPGDTVNSGIWYADNTSSDPEIKIQNGAVQLLKPGTNEAPIDFYDLTNKEYVDNAIASVGGGTPSLNVVTTAGNTSTRAIIVTSDMGTGADGLNINLNGLSLIQGGDDVGSLTFGAGVTLQSVQGATTTSLSLSGGAAAITGTLSIFDGVAPNDAVTVDQLNDAIAGVPVTPSNLALGTRTTTTIPITNSNGSGFTLPVATTSLAGLLSSVDKTKLDGIATGATANTGTVTSIALTLPTGLSVTGSPITTSGTLAVTFTGGYSIPTTASQTSWDNKQGAITFSTTGTGAATFIGNALNIPSPVATNLANGTVTATTYPITNSNGTGVTLAQATTTLAGLLNATDKVKINTIPTGGETLTSVLTRSNVTGLGANFGTTNTNGALKSFGGTSITALTNAIANGNTVFQLADNTQAISVGQFTGGLGIIQALTTANAARPITLNPFGGNVGINLALANPSVALDVNGIIRASSAPVAATDVVRLTELNTKADLLISIVARTASGTLALTESGKLINVTSATATTQTIPTNTTVAFPIGTQIIMSQEGAGQITIAAASGVTLHSAGNRLKSNVQYSTITLIKKDTNTWLVSGDLVV